MNLPPEYWYKNTEFSPLDYKPLDYPPFAAYFHSFIGTFITQIFVPEAVLLSTIDNDKKVMEGIKGVAEINPDISQPQKL